MKVGEGDAQSTSVADIFRKSSVCWSAACASYKGPCYLLLPWYNVVQPGGDVPLAEVRERMALLLDDLIFPSGSKVHINKRLSKR